MADTPSPDQFLSDFVVGVQQSLGRGIDTRPLSRWSTLGAGRAQMAVRSTVTSARAYDAAVLLDGAQSAAHMPVDVRGLNCDFFVLSGHKMYGPTGIGVLYGRVDRFDQMVPYQSGGDMILSVTFEKTTYNGLPFKFEAGTPPIMPAIALGEAVDYLLELGLANIARCEHELLAYATEEVARIPGLRVIGTAERKAAVLSMVMEGIHPHDLGTLLNEDGVAVRAGHHCAQPVMARYGIPATARASFAFYNTPGEVDTLVASLLRARKVFGLS